MYNILLIHMKIELDKKILEPLKSQIKDSWFVLFGTEMSKLLIERMNNASKIYVEDLLEKYNSIMISKWDSISIDKIFINFDINNRPISLKKEYSKLIKIQLIHELLHNISRNQNQTGIITSTNNGRALNEGITQMYAEDIYGFVISKYTDAYKDYKKIAKILRLTLGNDCIYKSYFLHEDLLEKTCAKISGDDKFYYKFNSLLTAHLEISKRKVEIHKDKKKLLIDILDTKIELCYKKIILNIVLPHLKKLNIYEKKNYIKELINIFEDDFQRKIEFKKLLAYYYNFTKEQIKIENETLDKIDTSLINKNSFISLLNQEDDSIIKNIFISNEGEITYNKDGNIIKISSYNLCSEIYKLMFRLKYKNKISKKDIIRIENIIKKGKGIVINADTIKDRRIIFEGIKGLLKERNIILLNNFYECDKSKIIDETSFINPEENDIISLNDLKKIYYKFNAKISYDYKGNKVLEVIDRKTGIKINNKNLQRLAYFATMWVASNNYNLDSAFDKEMQLFYLKLCYTIKCNKFNTGDLGIEELFKNFKYERFNKVLNYLFFDPLRYELSFEFFNSQLLDGNVMQAEREKSVLEYESDYMQEDSDSFVKYLLK